MSRFAIVALLFIFLTPTLAISQNFLNEPESIAYDPNSNSYLVSNCGNGTIVRIDSLGNQSYFSFAFASNYSVLGLFVYGDTLLAALNGPEPGLAGLSLTTAELLFHVVPEDAQLPNDVTVDRDGIIYLTDCEGNKVYRFIDLEPSVYFTGITYANGIYYDEVNHTLLVATSVTPHSIYSIDIGDSTITSLVQPPYRVLDGLAMDSERNIYYSSWETHSVYKYDSSFTNPPELISADHPGPADICIDPVNNLLCIPCYDADRVDFISLESSDVKEVGTQQKPDKYIEVSCIPNPFNPVTTIHFHLTNPANINFSVYNVRGQIVYELADSLYPVGDNAVLFDGSDLPSGGYFAVLSSDQYTVTRKIQLVK